MGTVIDWTERKQADDERQTVLWFLLQSPFQGTVQDVTERKRAEEDLRESERRYRESQLELAHLNRVTMMGQLAASIAHEVKQPITAAITSADAGLRWLAARPPDLEEVRSAFDDVVRAGNRAGEVIGRAAQLAQSSRKEC